MAGDPASPVGPLLVTKAWPLPKARPNGLRRPADPHRADGPERVVGRDGAVGAVAQHLAARRRPGSAGWAAWAGSGGGGTECSSPTVTYSSSSGPKARRPPLWQQSARWAARSGWWAGWRARRSRSSARPPRAGGRPVEYSAYTKWSVVKVGLTARPSRPRSLEPPPAWVVTVGTVVKTDSRVPVGHLDGAGALGDEQAPVGRPGQRHRDGQVLQVDRLAGAAGGHGRVGLGRAAAGGGGRAGSRRDARPGHRWGRGGGGGRRPAARPPSRSPWPAPPDRAPTPRAVDPTWPDGTDTAGTRGRGVRPGCSSRRRHGLAGRSRSPPGSVAHGRR